MWSCNREFVPNVPEATEWPARWSADVIPPDAGVGYIRGKVKWVDGGPQSAAKKMTGANPQLQSRSVSTFINIYDWRLDKK
jgi:hypothetical protein